MTVLRNFYGSILFTIIALLLAGWLGFRDGGNMAGALQMVFLAGVLGVMETSLSLDNAVVNASILKDMDEKWQRRFLTWGILIAVFGMQIVFPVVIVAVAAMVSPWEALSIAISDHARYETIVSGAHVGISGFGGAFLLLVGLSFFLDPDREHVWLKPIEAPLMALGRIPFATYLIALAVLGGISLIAHPGEQDTFLLSGVAGVVIYFIVDAIGDWLGAEEDANGVVVRSGLGGFIYLEFLDASFSFDGVIGAFAITNDILLIALGLGIGAMFVRSMTVALVRGGHLTQFRFLESGAFHAILALAFIMLFSIRIHVPEVVTGLLGASIIGVALWHSLAHRKRHPHEYGDPATEILPSGEVLPNHHSD